MSTQQRVLLSGASGLLGRALAASLERRGHDVVKLVRRAPRLPSEFEWHPGDRFVDKRALKGLDAVVHLSGAPIGQGRWTPKRKEELVTSRVQTTRFLAESLATSEDPPPVMISQSATGWYGDRGDELLDEASLAPANPDFLSDLTHRWEAAAEPATEAGLRVIHPRTGIVVSRDAQLVERLLPLAKAGVLGPLGSGDQWWSWVSAADTVHALEFLIESTASGAINVVSPNPVRQREFSKVLARALSRPSVVPTPASAVKLALGAEKAQALALNSARVVPTRLVDLGFEFRHTNLSEALEELQ